ncbi:unnamed protein product [Leptidea sinapis]|uniref:Uncharacterized protein n=1 Tax=Leptidea sinapis TaxID=189913 RepID=A0A5E4QB04_9NEOP|nr:unnamed protein product [Leptidea sinapis]
MANVTKCPAGQVKSPWGKCMTCADYLVCFVFYIIIIVGVESKFVENINGAGNAIVNSESILDVFQANDNDLIGSKFFRSLIRIRRRVALHL